jgi:23S rRNA (cytidine1920-2'-O)/16S rRNA (cytidine1409-2'-O)-methyltransferase
MLLVERGLAGSRTEARALILSGRVTSAGRRLDKPGQRLPGETPLEVSPGRRWVSRGAFKLSAALPLLGVDPAGADALDVGASNGGFTEVLLERGARRVAALDVGRGQLDWSLRQDSRVHVLEGLNARHLKPETLPFPPGLVVVDVSFISLRLVLPAIVPCLAAGGEIVALVKPQFEVGKGQVGAGGIVRDPLRHREVLEALVRLADERGWGPVDLCAAALRGSEGNQEYFLHLAPWRARVALAALLERIHAVTEGA